jgi:hypothetical protein
MKTRTRTRTIGEPLQTGKPMLHCNQASNHTCDSCRNQRQFEDSFDSGANFVCFSEADGDGFDLPEMIHERNNRSFRCPHTA